MGGMLIQPELLILVLQNLFHIVICATFKYFHMSKLWGEDHWHWVGEFLLSLGSFASYVFLPCITLLFSCFLEVIEDITRYKSIKSESERERSESGFYLLSMIGYLINSL